MNTRFAIAAGALAATLLAGCSGGKDKGGSSKCDFQFGNAGPVAQFDRDSSCQTNPWPSDRLLAGGRVAVPESRVSYALPDGSDFDDARTYLQQTSDTLDAEGWSTIAPIHVVLDSEVDLDTVADGIAFFRFDGTTPVADATAFDARWDADLNALLLQPLTPLAEATTYGVVVTFDLLDTDGRPTSRSREFQEYLSDAPLANDLALLSAGVPADAVSLAFSFTTADNTSDMVAIRNRVFASVGVHAPVYEDPSSFPGLPQGYFPSGSTEFGASLALAGMTTATNLAAIANGAFDSWDFRGTDGGAFDANLVEGSATPPVERIDFRLTIPAGTTPAGGWPVVIYGHGLGGQNTDVYRWGNELAKYGFAVIGISALQHGYRGTVPEFFNWESMPTTREHFRQTYADHLQLLRMVEVGVATSTPPFDQLDSGDVSYFGISLGGIMGSSFLSLAPSSVEKGLLVVPGGHLARELYAEEVGGSYFYPFLANRAGIEPEDPEFLLFVKGFEMLVQVGLDRADPVNYAARVVAPNPPFPGASTSKHVLQTISVGDTWVPNDTNEALQRALGIPTLTATTTSAGGVSGAWRFDDADFPQVAGDEPHGYFSSLCEAQEMGFHWLESGATEVVDPTTITCP